MDPSALNLSGGDQNALIGLCAGACPVHWRPECAHVVSRMGDAGKPDVSGFSAPRQRRVAEPSRSRKFSRSVWIIGNQGSQAKALDRTDHIEATGGHLNWNFGLTPMVAFPAPPERLTLRTVNGHVAG